MLDLLRAWDGTGVGGLSQHLRELLPSLERHGNVVGEAVRTICPTQGALTIDEERRLAGALHDARARGSLPLADYAAAVLTIAIYPRPLQLAVSKCRDLHLDGPEPTMDVTRLKQGQGIRPRTLFRNLELLPSLAALLRLQRADAWSWADENGMRRDEAPVFPAIFQRNRATGPCLPGLRGHLTGQQFADRAKAAFDALGVRADDERTRLNVTFRRLRRTCGTRAAEWGRPLGEIACVLDHSSTKTTMAYIQANSALLARLDVILDPALGQLAAAFRGEPVAGATYGLPPRGGL